MKKLLVVFVFFFSAASLFAQETIFIKKENIRQELQQLFAREQEANTRLVSQEIQRSLQDTLSIAAPQHRFSLRSPASAVAHTAAANSNVRPPVPNSNADKQWQIVMFLAAEDRPFSETLGTVKWLINRGNLRRAALLRIPDETAPQALLYFVYKSPKGAVTERMSLDLSVPTRELLSALFQNLNAREALYTGFIVDAHGSGMDMYYAQNRWMDLEDLMHSLNTAQLKADVLNLDSCHMGSFYTVYHLARYHRVKYLLASSDFMYASSERMYYLLLNNLQYTPQKAALNTTRQMKALFDFDPSYDVNNSLAMDMEPLYAPAKEWFESYGQLVVNMDKNIKEKLDAPFDPRFGEVRSLHKIIRRQAEIIQQAEDEAFVSDWDCPYNAMKENFVRRSYAFIDALDQSLLTQWCYSPRTGRLYSGRIPPNIDCSDGISVTKTQLAQLVEEHKTALEERSPCGWHRW